MPQIAQLAETWSSQVFWLLVFFGITFFVIGRGMVPLPAGWHGPQPFNWRAQKPSLHQD